MRPTRPSVCWMNSGTACRIPAAIRSSSYGVTRCHDVIAIPTRQNCRSTTTSTSDTSQKTTELAQNQTAANNRAFTPALTRGPSPPLTCHPGPLQRLRVYRLRPILDQVHVMPLDAPDVLLPAIQPLPGLHHIAIPSGSNSIRFSTNAAAICSLVLPPLLPVAYNHWRQQ